MIQPLHTFYVTTPNERPDFRLILAFLWGDDRNVDSDGNAANPASRTWTELYLQLREPLGERVDIVEYKLLPLILKVSSESKQVAARVAYLLAKHTQGHVSYTASGPYRQPDVLIPDMGQDFDIGEAFARVRNSPFAKSTLENPYPNLETTGQYKVYTHTAVWRERLWRTVVHLLRFIYRGKGEERTRG